MQHLFFFSLLSSCLAISLTPHLLAGEIPVETQPAKLTSARGEQNWFGAPSIRFAGSKSDTLLPGYTIGTVSYLHRFSAEFDKGELGEVSADEFSFWAPFMGINYNEYHLFAGFGYDAVQYNTSGSNGVSLLTEHTLHSFSIPIVFIHDVSEKWLWGGMVMPTYAGAESSSDNLAISAGLGVGYSYSSHLELFAGVYYYNGFGDELIIPGVAFIWRPAPRWEAYLLPPVGGVTYSVTDQFVVGLFGQYDSPTWHVKADRAGPARDISMSGLRLGLKAEYKVAKHFWAYAATGITIGQSMTIENAENETLQKSDIDMAPFIQIGLNLRF